MAFSPGTAWRILWPFAAALGVYQVLAAIGSRWVAGFQLDLGSRDLAAPRHLQFLAVWIPFGLLFAVLVGVGLYRASRVGDWFSRRLDAAAAVSDRAWILGGALAALVLPLLVRALVLEGADIT